MVLEQNIYWGKRKELDSAFYSVFLCLGSPHLGTFSSLLAGGFLQTLMPVAHDFYFGWLKINSTISETLCELCACVLSCFSCVQLFVTLWIVAHPGSSVLLSRQDYWSGLPCPPPGDLPDPGIKPRSLTSPALTGGFFTTSATWKPNTLSVITYNSELPLWLRW